MTGAVAIDLDGALGDTRPLWTRLARSASARSSASTPRTLPADRGEAAAELDRRGGGNWRRLLERFARGPGRRVPTPRRRRSAALRVARGCRPRDRGVHRRPRAAGAGRPRAARSARAVVARSRPAPARSTGCSAGSAPTPRGRRAHARWSCVEQAVLRRIAAVESQRTSATASSTRCSSDSTASPRSSSA